MPRIVLMVFVGCALLPITLAAQQSTDDEIFSGPQVGEKITSFQVRNLIGDQEDQNQDWLKDAADQPVFVIFVHKRTRPSIGLTRLLMNYAGSRKKDGLHSGVVFLTSDLTETQQWVKRARRALPNNVSLGASIDGEEGPGSYGLNRHVTLTVLVAKDQKVTANFALVQPSVQADAPRILKSITDLIGGTPPTLEQLGARQGRGNRGQRPNRNQMSEDQQPRLRALLRPLLRKDATQDQIDEVARKIEAEAAEDAKLRQQIGNVARRIIQADRLENYGNEACQAYLKKWAESFDDQS